MISVEAPGNVEPQLQFDMVQIGGAIDNLLLNAIQNSDDGTTIVLRGDIAGNRLRLSVADTGRGVPLNIREHLFEPFATGRPDGTGLGLAIVREVAEAHGGQVVIAHRSDGTTFTLDLPIGERS